ncbi:MULTISPECIES: WhiB family transcriptional regulator [unclassified Streptomyces]|uniref:WhiB family transcriptional regulator n=1 Tax=unclassified Streptomyces TaxID=2593676 RepID=UPI00117CD0D2|nr:MULTISPECIES: WhiB family transcriptional regulator [unclassified Streptomyces]
MASAVCAGVDPELWHGGGGALTKAKKICAGCPVRLRCEAYGRELEGATSQRYRHGVWGGTDAKARAKRRKESRPVKADRDATVIRLAEQGVSPTEIAALVGVTTRTVHRVKANTERSAA